MISLLNPYIILAAIGLLAGSAVTGYNFGKTQKQAEWDAAVVASKQAQEATLKAAAEAIAKIEVVNETLIQPIRTEIRTNTVYRECKHSDSVMRNLNSLILGAESVSLDGMPETNPTE